MSNTQIILLIAAIIAATSVLIVSTITEYKLKRANIIPELSDADITFIKREAGESILADLAVLSSRRIKDDRYVKLDCVRQIVIDNCNIISSTNIQEK